MTFGSLVCVPTLDRCACSKRMGGLMELEWCFGVLELNALDRTLLFTMRSDSLANWHCRLATGNYRTTSNKAGGGVVSTGMAVALRRATSNGSLLIVVSGT
jgi:hypothetical protein